VEEPLRRGFGPIDAGAELGDVQIDLQYPPFRPNALDQHREIRLERLAKITASGPKEQVLGNLLADGAGAAHLMTVLIQCVSLFDRLHVEAGVFGKFLILRSDHRERQIRRDLR